jgi:Protein of unknown function (DUF3037)
MNQPHYSASYLRYVHDPVTGEFANVGVLVWVPQSRELYFVGTARTQRLGRFFHDFSDDDHQKVIRYARKEFAKLAEKLKQQSELPFDLAAARARDLGLVVIPFDDATYQWSPSFGGYAVDAKAIAEEIFQEAIGVHQKKAPGPARRSEQVIYKEHYQATFESERVKPFILPHRVEAPRVAYDFQRSYQNGVWNCIEIVSLDYQNAETIEQRSLLWDARVRHLQDSNEKAKIHLLLGKPSEGLLREYDKAKDLMGSSKIADIIEEDGAADFCKELEEKVAKLALA